MELSRQPVAVDLFCGAGGLAGGLERAGFRTAAAVDFNADAVATLQATKEAAVSVAGQPDRKYLAGASLILADAHDLEPSTLWSGEAGGLDLLSGGPPCQPFSSAGKQRGLDDPRGEAFKAFVALADALRPKFILYENVRGLVTARDRSGRPGGVLRLLQESFEGIGYACRFALLNSADFGAPQRRVRLFMVGSSEFVLPEFPPPTHTKGNGQRRFFDLPPWASLGAAIRDLPRPAPEDVVWPRGERRGQIEALRPGTGLKSGGIVESNRPGGHWGYKQDCFKADLRLPGRTIRAASTPDWIDDPRTGVRRLTWRECAHVQGFDAGWQFQGSKASVFRQIGNAVQGQLATQLGVALCEAALRPQRSSPASPPWPEYFLKRVRYTEMEERVNGAARSRARRA